ncbi:MAG: histidinol dehydrogenase, partial [Pseudomonadota bacterium]
MPSIIRSDNRDFESFFQTLLLAKREDSPDVDATVAQIISDVRELGDAAVIDLTEQFDGIALTPDTMAFSESEINEEISKVTVEEAEALQIAADRIRAYHERQLPEDASWEDETGAMLGWRWTPVDAAGLYVPGGTASYPSSVLMNAIPAQVAGVKELSICCPTPGGQINPLVLLAAQISGVDTIYRIGGAQAIAALAYGTESIAKVDKITGPGNAFVAA